MILILDNHDSFTYNLIHQVEALGHETHLLQSDKATVAEIEKLNPKGIILSAGPKTPSQAGITLEVIEFFLGKKPILGVCLGFQALAVAAGVALVGAKELIHGRAVSLQISDCKLFKGVKKPLFAARYNSLVLGSEPPNYKVIAKDDLGQIMAIEHEEFPVFGVQFHLESFMTKQGQYIMRNFLSVTSEL
ncbi:MAG: gamma-glutamyl-gamma-aminobutyrate hydrolase family protein [SAR324 cluster bacterium]|nr:gamma-glutamyl-gamma-aminobutyrate hydrolase family protein [SAR324 cluster bacterium]